MPSNDESFFLPSPNDSPNNRVLVNDNVTFMNNTSNLQIDRLRTPQLII